MNEPQKIKSAISAVMLENGTWEANVCIFTECFTAEGQSRHEALKNALNLASRRLT